MSSSNINDPAAVAALLEQLQASNVWQQIVSEQAQSAAVPVSAPEPEPAPAPADSEVSDAPSHRQCLPACMGRAFDASGNQQLPICSPSIIITPKLVFISRIRCQPGLAIGLFLPPPGPAAPSVPPLNPRSCTFQEALPLLSRLGADSVFVAAINRLRQDQDSLERKLWTDREAIQRKYADKVKVAKTQATIIGADGLSKHDAMMLQDAYQREIRKFDKERVLSAWDALAARQQAQLEALGVPNMFVTSEPKDKERQKQIIQVLVGLVGNDS
ncbi:hypothetical protein D9611_002295 [Ephemerocybe angulata]|uniref:Uncharacterized protein n=1 Tax=Ephemerocybe angulata TaxID=980116 RepID=A0A8H5C1U3_9AGAR|nr:hypothetical protein D9611_002295 [Tulosesus angulatus]